MSKPQKKTFGKKVEAEKIDFINFDETPTIQVELQGTKELTIEGEKKTFHKVAMIEGGEVFLLPNNVMLQRLIEAVKEGEECEIRFIGFIKPEGAKNKMRNFELYTA